MNLKSVCILSSLLFLPLLVNSAARDGIQNYPDFETIVDAERAVNDLANRVLPKRGGDDVFFIDRLNNEVIISTLSATFVNISTFSSIQCNTGNGHGSTDDKVRRFSSCTIAGTDIAMSSTSANAQKFTINTSGVYSTSYSDFSTTVAIDLGISVNAASLTTGIGTLSIADGKRIDSSTAGANFVANVGVTLILSVGDIVRAETGGNADGTTERVNFIITRVR